MKTPSTANIPTEGPQTSHTPADRPEGRSQTKASVKGESSPRLPHERDESSDSGARASDELMKTAHDDAESERVATDRSEESDATYERLRRDKPER